jgi:hypothetical protein
MSFKILLVTINLSLAALISCDINCNSITNRNQCEAGPCKWKGFGQYPCVQYNCSVRSQCDCKDYCVWYNNGVSSYCTVDCVNRSSCLSDSNCKYFFTGDCGLICTQRNADSYCLSQHGCQRSGNSCVDVTIA